MFVEPSERQVHQNEWRGGGGVPKLEEKKWKMQKVTFLKKSVKSPRGGVGAIRFGVAPHFKIQKKFCE